MDMKERLQELAEAAGKRISESEGLEKLNEVRVAYLGKKGELTAILKSMKDVAPEERPKVGQLVNETRSKIEALLDESKQKLEEAAREEKMKQEVIDVTLPAKKAKIGHRHPNTIALEEVERIFIGMGYEVVEGPEVEYADYNFTKLNIPENHPARDEQDTFFINDSILLRSQTSAHCDECGQPITVCQRFTQIFEILCPIILGKLNGKSLGESGGYSCDNPHQKVNSAQCCKSLYTCNLANDHGIHHCIKLLTDIPQHQGNCKKNDQPSRRTGGHILNPGFHWYKSSFPEHI